MWKRRWARRTRQADGDSGHLDTAMYCMTISYILWNFTGIWDVRADGGNDEPDVKETDGEELSFCAVPFFPAAD